MSRSRFGYLFPRSLLCSDRLHNRTDIVQANQLSFRRYPIDIGTITLFDRTWQWWCSEERRHNQHFEKMLAGRPKKRTPKEFAIIFFGYRTNWPLNPEADRSTCVLWSSRAEQRCQKARLTSILDARILRTNSHFLLHCSFFLRDIAYKYVFFSLSWIRCGFQFW